MGGIVRHSYWDDILERSFDFGVEAYSFGHRVIGWVRQLVSMRQEREKATSGLTKFVAEHDRSVSRVCPVGCFVDDRLVICVDVRGGDAIIGSGLPVLLQKKVSIA